MEVVLGSVYPIFQPQTRENRTDPERRFVEFFKQCELYQKHPDCDRTEFFRNGKRFIKLMSQQAAVADRVKEAQKELMALRLGIKSEVFARNPGFYEFAEEAFLPKHLARHGKTISINSEGNILIEYEGTFHKWNDISEQFATDKLPPKSSRWLYGPKGVQIADVFEWRELRPFKIDDPAKWKKGYLFEICVYVEETLKGRGEHSWFRLYTPDGEIYSVGLYAERKGRSMHKQPGKLQCPDVSEVWDDEFEPSKIVTLPIIIGRNGFRRVVYKVHKDLREGRTFHPIDANCVLWNMEYLNIIGCEDIVKEKTRRFAGRLAVRMVAPALERSGDAVGALFPRKVKTVATHCLAVPFWNLVQIILGSSALHPKVDPARVSPHLRLWQLFNSTKLVLYHPHILAEVLREIQEWREQNGDEYGLPSDIKKLKTE